MEDFPILGRGVGKQCDPFLFNGVALIVFKVAKLKAVEGEREKSDNGRKHKK